MVKVNAFDVMKKLCGENNPGFAMAPLSNIIAVDQKGVKCTFLIGVDANAVKNWMLDKTKHGGLMLIDGDAYRAAEKELAAPKSYHAYHVPTGENWHILGIDKEGNRVCAAGYPPTIGKLSDCRGLIEFQHLTEEELSYRRKAFGENWD